jgi:hypothetical protein
VVVTAPEWEGVRNHAGRNGVDCGGSILHVHVPCGAEVDEQGKPFPCPQFPLFAPYIFAIVYLIFGCRRFKPRKTRLKCGPTFRPRIAANLTVLIGSAIYNLLFKYIGGFEFEQKDKEA